MNSYFCSNIVNIKYLSYKKYGHYCNTVREMKIDPVPFWKFKEVFRKDINATMKNIINNLIGG